MKFKLEFDCDNAAFDRDHLGEVEPYEISTVLGNARSKVDRGFRSGTIVDSNGNTIGSWELG